MELSTLENWLWDAACKIRGPIDAPKFKDYILPLIFLKRLSDVFSDEVAGLGETYKDLKTAQELVKADHSLVRFYIPPKSHWSYLAQQSRAGLGEVLTDAVRGVSRENPRLAGVIDVTDFNATAAGQRIISDEHLHELVQVLHQHRLGLKDVEPDLLGRAYEYLIRKFAEGQGQSAGEFYTPRPVALLMARILDPKPGQTVYDPACGSGGLLIKCHLRLVETHGVQQNGRKVLPSTMAPLRVFGQEINPTTFAMSRMNAFLHDIEAEIALGDTMRSPRFLDQDGGLRKFNLVTANPMWNQKFSADMYENDPFERFGWGVPPNSSADWGWVQHMVASLRDDGRMAVVLDTGAVSRGSGNQGSNKERDIRKAFIENDLIEAVFLMPENMFYNTTAPGIILVLNRKKLHPGEILLVNGSKQFSKGKPKNYLDESHISILADSYFKWEVKNGLCSVIAIADAAKNDFNLSPSRYISVGEQSEVSPLDEALVELQEAEEELQKANQLMRGILDRLRLGNSR
ncbi:MAG: SAM-dependent DNA methyltransferase [Candidatus Aminicenantes bacterium]|nr:SAM-dependent DNA methyltransferase [Candidatus Aminicenantes bacterium]